MHFFQILLLAVIQGFTELLPVSSSAHVIVAEKMMGIDPTSPEMTLLLVMLHTGTMGSVLVFFGKDWKKTYFRDRKNTLSLLRLVFLSSLTTGLLGFGLKSLIENISLQGIPDASIEMIFGNLKLISLSLATVGAVILIAAFREGHTSTKKTFGIPEAYWIGMFQGLCLPFRGFSRSGATISAGLILGIDKKRSEDFSFALALVLTPPVVLREAHRLMKTHAFWGMGASDVLSLFLPSLLGMILSFGAGLLALHLLSSWLEKGRWAWFGVYCLAFSGLVWFLA
ncbi:MAG TPA: undecaprenyl-diphosphate phosphatase [bacterium]|nr:undecaprenyl-diphosphate phosphatase [bacterium]